MADPAHGVFEEISESIEDIEPKDNGKCENENVFDCCLTATPEFHG